MSAFKFEVHKSSMITHQRRKRIKCMCSALVYTANTTYPPRKVPLASMLRQNKALPPFETSHKIYEHYYYYGLLFVCLHIYIFVVASSSSTFKKVDASNHRKPCNKLLHCFASHSFSFLFFFVRLVRQQQCQPQQQWRWQHFTLKQTTCIFHAMDLFWCWYRRSFFISLISTVASFGLHFYRFSSHAYKFENFAFWLQSECITCNIALYNLVRFKQ